MRRLVRFILNIILILILAGCGNRNMEQNGSKIENSISFEKYSGCWSYEGKTYKQILEEGGVELSCTITGDNQFSGTLFSQQGITGRIASIEDIAENDNDVDSGYDSSWTEEEIIRAVNERNPYYISSAYYSEIIDYWENVREVRDISNLIEPLFETDKKYYTKAEFESEPMLVIHLAKNEIYARHGYIFTNKDLYNYFMGCIWYSPTCDSADFDDGIFNEYERANLEILSELDTY